MQSANLPSRKTLRIRLEMPQDITFGRNVIMGIFRYVRIHQCPWTIEMTNGYGTLRDRLDARCPPPDGIIGGNHPLVLDAIRADSANKMPVVAVEINRSMDSHMRKNGITIIQTDNEAIGKKAGEALVACGSMRSFAYIHLPSVGSPKFYYDQSWTSVRCASFAATVKQRNMPFREFTWGENTPLALFLRELPKPAGVFVGNDRIAMDVLTICRAEGIVIPKDLALISVDNDPLYCDNVSPTISSIVLNAEEEGYRAGAELDRLLRSRRPCKSRVVMIPPGEVIFRESTTFMSPAAVLVEHALAYIRDNVDSAITVGDVAKAVGVSRRLLELRFNECRQPTISDLIRNERFRHTERLLAETKLPVARIADSCGFPSVNSLMRAFKKRYGVSPGQWRKASLRRADRAVPRCLDSGREKCYNIASDDVCTES